MKIHVNHNKIFPCLELNKNYILTINEEAYFTEMSFDSNSVNTDLPSKSKLKIKLKMNQSE